MNFIGQIVDLLNTRERVQAIVLLCMILMMALLDALGIASIMPFMAVLANPELTQTNVLFAQLYHSLSGFGIDTKDGFLFFLGVIVFALLTCALLFKALTTYAQLRFALMREHSIGKRLIEGYLHQSYQWFLNKHSADLGKNILSDVAAIIGNGLMPLLNLIAQSAVAFAILILLVLVDPVLALAIGAVLTLAYVGVYKFLRGYLVRIGTERLCANLERFVVVSEAFGASKEVKVAGLENEYIERFSVPSQLYARNEASAMAAAQLPRFLLEAIVYGGMLLLVLFLLDHKNGLAEALPIISLYAFSGYRLMPALQQIYGCATQLRFVGPSLSALHQDLMSLETDQSWTLPAKQIKLNKELRLENVVFGYPGSAKLALDGVSMKIRPKSVVGLVGSTGSGKTSLVDLILGLYFPQSGALFVDNNQIGRMNSRHWQKSIGYVPQQIFLSDDSILGNIAFGIKKDRINYAAVERAAKIANLHDFVVDNLPLGYATIVGERGVRLSGGQRQRIGIARALYNAPQVLILDEATSALDSLTEQAVMEAVYNLGHEITIILVAHRLSTVRSCDEIYLLEEGKIKESGSYDELIASNGIFQAMAAQ